MKNERLKYSLVFAALGAVFFISFLGGVHLFDWDEINFAEAAREMIVLGDYLHINIDFKPFWEKPPLFFWLQVLSMKVFGIGEFAARFPNAICGIIVLVLLFNLGTKLHNKRFGILWAMAYFGSVLPNLYFKSGIIDPWFNLFIFLNLYFLIRFHWAKNGFENEQKVNWGLIFMAGIFMGLAILTKGPVALLVTGITLFIYWIYQRLRFYINPLQFLLYLVVAVGVTSLWFGVEILNNGTWFVKEFIVYQYRLFSTPDAGHDGFPGFHPVVLLVGCFPASIFTLRSFFKWQKSGDKKQDDLRIWMLIFFWVVLILFVIVRSKIVHYSSLCYYPLTYLAAVVIERIIDGKLRFSLWMKGVLVGIASIYILAFFAAPYVGKNIGMIQAIVADEFTRANLDAQVHWTGWEVMPGFVILAAVIVFFFLQKKGRLYESFIGMFGLVAAFVLLTLIFYVNRIEAYSQRAAIEFLEERQGEDCYILSPGYKTYADMFYTRKQPAQANDQVYQMLLDGNNTKPIYVIAKINKLQDVEGIPNLEKLGSKNGFVFYRKEAVSASE